MAPNDGADKGKDGRALAVRAPGVEEEQVRFLAGARFAVKLERSA
jgi:hypothetical protein